MIQVTIDNKTQNGGTASASVGDLAKSGQYVAQIGDSINIIMQADAVAALEDPSKIELISKGVVNIHVSVTPILSAGLTPMQPVLTPSGGVNLGYNVNESPVKEDTTIALYWAKGPDWDDRLSDTPVYTKDISAGTSVGPHSLPTVPVSSLLAEDPPAGTTYLLAVTDPENKLGSFDAKASVKPLQLPLISMLQDNPQERIDWNRDRDGSVAYADHRGFNFGYSIIAADLPVTTKVEFY